MNQVKTVDTSSLASISSGKNFEDMLRDKFVSDARKRHAVLVLKIRQRSVLDLIRADVFLALELEETSFKVSLKGVGFTSKSLLDNEIGEEFKKFVQDQGLNMKIVPRNDGGGMESWDDLEFSKSTGAITR